MSRLSKTAAVAVVAALIAAAFIGLRSKPMTLTAYFTQAKGMYVGDDVTILGVTVGKVAKITPKRTKVEVKLEIDTKRAISSDAKAALVAPSLVSVRAVAIGPAYQGGPRMHNGDVIPLSRTSVPVEWDEVKDQLVRLTTALGPRKGAKTGPLGDLVSSSAKLLDGEGTKTRETVKNLSEALSTLSDNRGNLFATVRNLQVFVSALNDSDAQVRDFNTRLADVSSALAGDGTELKGALAKLSAAFIDVQSFVRDNKSITVKTLKELQQTTSLLSENRQYLADVLQVAPTSVSNFYNIMDPRVPGPTGELVLANLAAPAEIICGTLLDLGGTPEDCRTALGPIVKYLGLTAPPIGLLPGSTSGVDPSQLDPLGGQSSSGTSASKGNAASGDADLLKQLSSMLGGDK